jgi:hypothetical protein
LRAVPWRLRPEVTVIGGDGSAYRSICAAKILNCHVAEESTTDILRRSTDVRFTPESGHSPTRSGCLLWAETRHQPRVQTGILPLQIDSRRFRKTTCFERNERRRAPTIPVRSPRHHTADTNCQILCARLAFSPLSSLLQYLAWDYRASLPVFSYCVYLAQTKQNVTGDGHKNFRLLIFIGVWR